MFVGTVESISNAKVLLEYHLAHLKVSSSIHRTSLFTFFVHIFIHLQEVEKLRQDKIEIDQQLRSMHGNSMGSVQSFPTQRRSDR